MNYEVTALYKCCIINIIIIILYMYGMTKHTVICALSDSKGKVTNVISNSTDAVSYMCIANWLYTSQSKA